MSIFIDQNYRCHIQNDGTMREVENKFFDGKCKTFVEGYRYVPDGETWVNWDGFKFRGEMIAPFKPYEGLVEAQEAYEEAMAEAQAQLEDMKSALDILGVTE